MNLVRNFLTSYDFTIPLRLVMALAAGGLIGYERSQMRRAAGLRTHMLVCLSSCAVMIVNLQLFERYGTGDPVRLGAQVISGIGFLGTGCILVTDKKKIKGMTTAAGLWADACLGLCIGAGCYSVAIISMIAIYLTLTVMHSVDHRRREKIRYLRTLVTFDSVEAMTEFMRMIKVSDAKVINFETVKTKKHHSGEIAIIIELRFGSKVMSEDVLSDWRMKNGIVWVQRL